MPSSKSKQVQAKRKWSHQQKANFIAAMKARREALSKGLEPPIPKYKQSTKKSAVLINEPTLFTNKEAIIYLQHAERLIVKNLRDGKQKNLSQDQLLMLLALSSLRGHA